MKIRLIIGPGGIYVDSDSNAVLTNCTFTDNFADSKGGGICIEGITSFADCTFTGNTAGFRGGAICNQGTATLTNCILTENSASGGTGNGCGGAISGFNGSSTLKNCLLYGNYALLNGGAVFGQTANLTMENCTFTENSVGNHGRAMATSYGGQAQLTNCIFWDGGDEFYDYANPSSINTITYSDIQGGASGTGNINTNPLFVDGPDGDYYLSQIAAGQTSNSPCVNAGSDTVASLGMDLFTTRTDKKADEGIVDMGYHYPRTIWSPDIDESWHVDFSDYASLAAAWLTCNDMLNPNCTAGTLRSDLNNDEYVDAEDLRIFADGWLDCYVTRADRPYPVNNATYTELKPVLSWSAGEGGLYHDIYFGTDFTDVNDADTSSVVYQGRQDSTNWDSNDYDSDGLALSTTYYWRVDEIGPACTARGNVLHFTTADVDISAFLSLWQLDESSGTTAHDSIGSNHGTLYGNPQWTTGKIGGALNFDGVDDYVKIPDDDSLNPAQQITIAYWICARTAGGGVYKYASCPDQTGKGSPGNSRAYTFGIGGDSKAGLTIYMTRDLADSIQSVNTVSLNQWHHIAATFNQGQAAIYIDGQLENTKTMSVSSIMNDAQPVMLGGYWEYCTPKFVSTLSGMLDDVRIYSRALSDGEVQQLYHDSLNKAFNPNPANGVSNIGTNPLLTWSAGESATSHDVYLGTSFADVSSSTTPVTTTSAASYNPGTLSYSTTYYWRIDEFDGTVTVKGDIWSFTTMSGKASNPSPANSAPSVDTNIILNWTAAPYATSHDVYFGTSSSDVDSSTTPVATTSAASYNPGTLSYSTTYYWRIDEFDGTVTVKGGVWSFTTISGKSSNPNPSNGVINQNPYSTLSWSAASHATSHDVYLGTSFSEVDSSITPVATTSAASYDPGTLNYATTYYWRIDEFDGTVTVKGDIWSFTTWAQFDPNFGLVGWWKLDETSGTTASDSALANQGTLYGSPVWTTGQIDGALDFDTSGDYVRIPDNASLNPAQQITIAYWIYMRTAGGGVYKYATCPGSISNGSPGNSRAYILGIGGDSKAGLTIYSAVNTVDSCTGTNTVSLNQWQHVAATFNAGQAKIYINGQPDNTKTMSVSAIMNDAQPVTLGGYWQYCTPTFVQTLNGMLDDVRIYNRVLSDGEVQQLYNDGLP